MELGVGCKKYIAMLLWILVLDKQKKSLLRDAPLLIFLIVEQQV